METCFWHCCGAQPRAGIQGPETQAWHNSAGLTGQFPVIPLETE
jgi:hypothetical protein